jgi:flagellar assembly factor FliW
MRIETTRFGTIEIDDGKLISFPQGLPGFWHARRFVLLEHAPNVPFHWLQCVDDPSLAFVVIDPLPMFPDLRDAIPAFALEALGIGKSDEAAILTIVTIDREGKRVTTNLLGPLVINTRTRTGVQLILEGSGYNTKHEIVKWTSTDQPQSATP